MVRTEIDLSRYCIGKGREEQVELLSEDELSDFYSQEDHEKLEKIEKEIRDLFLIHEKVPFINVDQILDLYYNKYHSKFDLDSFARSSDATLSEFIRTTWPQSFVITTCPNNNSEWISLIPPNIVQDESFDTFKKTKPNGYDKGLYDIRFDHDARNIENEKKAEQILRKTQYLVPNRTVLYPCCLELLYKESYKENVDIKSTGYQSFSELMHNSIIWEHSGNYEFILDNEKRDTLLLKKELNDLQIGVMSIILGKYYGDTLLTG